MKVVGVFAFVAFAATTNFAEDVMSLNDDPVFVKETGGMMRFKTAGTQFLFADAMKVKQEYRPVLELMGSECKLDLVLQNISLAEGEDPYAVAQKLFATKRFGAMVVLYDGSKNAPVMVAYPENGLAILNVSPLRESADDVVFRSRFEKELWRALCFAAGGATSGIPMCVMKPVVKPQDLDGIECTMASPPATEGVIQTAPKLGLSMVTYMSYYDLLKAGHNIEPTNDVQRAVHQRVQRERAEAMKGPTAPIRIKYNKATGR